MSDTEKQAVPPSSPPTVAGEDDSIRCLCGSKLDNKGLMLCCELCELWSHASCYRVKKKDVPDDFFCAVCRPPITELDFSAVEDPKLRSMLEEDRDAGGYKPNMPRKVLKPSNELVFKFEERLMLERYWKLYAAAHQDDRPAIAGEVGRLLSGSGDAIEALFVLIAEDILSGRAVPEAPPADQGPGQMKPVGRGEGARGSSFSKSVQGERTVRPEPTLIEGPLSCAVKDATDESVVASGGCCQRKTVEIESGGEEQETCWCRQQEQECAAEGICEQCGCGEQCENANLRRAQGSDPDLGLKVELISDGAGWRVVATQAVAAGAFLGQVVGKVGDAHAGLKGYWTLPLRKDCREIHVLSRQLVWDMERVPSSTVRWMRRSCQPAAHARAVWVGRQLQLGVWVGSSALVPGQEVTLAWDRPWDSLMCHVPCACGAGGQCPVRTWYNEREALAQTLPVVAERIGTRRTEPPKPRGKLAMLETTLNPFPEPSQNRLSREERKLQQVLKTIEKLERQEQTAAKASPVKSVQALPSDAAIVAAESPNKRAKMVAQDLVADVTSDANVVRAASVSPPSAREASPPPAAVPVATPPPPVPTASPQVSLGRSGKKAWLRKFSDAGEQPLPPVASPLPIPAVDPSTLSPAVYGWKKRVLMTSDRASSPTPPNKSMKRSEL